MGHHNKSGHPTWCNGCRVALLESMEGWSRAMWRKYAEKHGRPDDIRRKACEATLSAERRALRFGATTQTVNMPTDNQTEKATADSQQQLVRRGWRFFHCGECEHRWKWPSRDALSPSGENCPRCNEWCHAFNHEIDASIPCDSSGNLTVPYDWQGKTPNASS